MFVIVMVIAKERSKTSIDEQHCGPTAASAGDGRGGCELK